MSRSSLVRESYPLIPPFAYALIQTDPKTRQTKYTVVEAPLSTDEIEKLKMIKDVLVENLDINFNALKNQEEAGNYLNTKVLKIIKEYGIKADDKTIDKLNYHIQRDFIGFGKIEPLLRDHMIEDISCDGIGIPIYIYHREHESISSNIIFDNESELDSFIIKIAQRAGRHISVASPLLDASLPDGSRVQLTYGKEVTQRGSTFTIRKFRADPMTITDLVSFNTIDVDIAAYFWISLENGKSAVIAGGTASGKTTLLNSLAMFIRPGNKIVSIEDTAELNLPHENWIPSVARTGFGGREADGTKRGEINMFDLLKAAMRQRPDFLFVGEVRGAEAYTLFQAMATGHTGMGTIHGDSTQGIIRRLESEPMNIPRTLIQSLNVVSVQKRVRRGDKIVRRATEIVEIVGIDSVTEDLITNRLFGWDPREDIFVNYGRSYVLEDIQNALGISETEMQDELDRRKTVLRWMVKTKKNHFNLVNQVIQDYYKNPEQTLDRAERELRAL